MACDAQKLFDISDYKAQHKVMDDNFLSKIDQKRKIYRHKPSQLEKNHTQTNIVV